MSTRYRFHGQLLCPPFLGRPSRAATRLFPLQTEDDYRSYAALPKHGPPVPILVSMAEKQELLLKLVEHAVSELKPLDNILLTARIPVGERIPERLLAADVFMVHDPDIELSRLREDGRAVLTIADGFVRHQVELGCNQVDMEWYVPDADPVRWEAFITALACWGIGGRMEGGQL